jgi:hypothetical protein
VSALTPEELAAHAREATRTTRAAQGLPPGIEDPGTLATLAVIFRAPPATERAAS